MPTTLQLYYAHIHDSTADFPTAPAVDALRRVIERWHHAWHHQRMAGRLKMSLYLGQIARVLAKTAADEHAVVYALRWFEHDLQRQRVANPDTAFRPDQQLSRELVEMACEFMDGWRSP